MWIIYIYDIDAKDKKKFNRTKRMFYYYLNQLPIKKDSWKTKSTIVVMPKQEKILDRFFRKFKSTVLVYKIHADLIERFE